MRPIFILILLLKAIPLSAQNWVPDRVYLSKGTVHFGLDHMFPDQGPNEDNLSIGLAWKTENSGISYNVGVYKDSYADIALTMGVSHMLVETDKSRAALGIAYTHSFGGDTLITNNGINRTIEPRRYIWPYLNFEYQSVFLQLRAGLNKEREAAGVVAFGIVVSPADFIDN